jgi:hypothetical protein
VKVTVTDAPAAAEAGFTATLEILAVWAKTTEGRKPKNKKITTHGLIKMPKANLKTLLVKLIIFRIIDSTFN